MICIACARQEWIITSCVHGILQRILLLYDDFIPHQIDQWMKTNIHVHCMHALPISPKKTSTSVLITRLERLGGPQITHQIKQQSNSVPKFKNFLYHDTRALLHNKINIVQKNRLWPSIPLNVNTAMTHCSRWCWHTVYIWLTFLRLCFRKRNLRTLVSMLKRVYSPHLYHFEANVTLSYRLNTWKPYMLLTRTTRNLI